MSGVVWDDANGNGIRDPGKAGKPGGTVQLWFAGPNGQIGGEIRCRGRDARRQR